MAQGFSGSKVDEGYLPVYLRLAAELGERARVCELGVSYGCSLSDWQYLFPHGEVTGVDADPDSTWPEGTRMVVSDQADPGLPGVLGGPFDLIVDDASHQGGQTRRSWELLWPLLAPGGFYVVEDWQCGILPVWRGWAAGDSMLRAAESFLPLLDSRDGEVESIEYRFGLIVMRKRG